MSSDQQRNCFYTLSSKNVIAVYKPNGDKSIQHLQTIANIYKSAQDKAPGSPALTPQSFQIIALHVIDPSESRVGLQLLAITTNGVRLYFGPSPSSFGASGSRLQLLHVRLPPSNLLHPDEQTSIYRPPVAAYGIPQPPPQSSARPYLVTTLENSCYVDGLTVAAQQGDTDGTDYILCIAPDLTRIGSLGQTNLPPQQPINQQQQPFFSPTYPSYSGSSHTSRPPLTEYAALIAIPGRTWAMAVVPTLTPLTLSPTSSFTPTQPAPAIINELARQFGESPHQFMLLTNVGLTFLTKRRAVDYLKAVLEELQSEGSVQPIIELRDR